MFCPKCGVEFASNAKFFHKCGAALPSLAPNTGATTPSAPAASTPEAAKRFRWGTVLKFAAVGAVLALFLVHPPTHLRDPINTIAYKVIGMFIWGFFGAVAGAIISFFRRG